MALDPKTRIAVVVTGIVVLIGKALFSVEVSEPQYSFDKEPYIHPRIIEDLSTWESDRGEQVVAVNLVESMDTNRYFGEVKAAGKGSPFVYYETDVGGEGTDPRPAGFGYRLMGRSSSGVFVLLTESGGGGTGRFRNLLLVFLEKDTGLSYEQKSHTLKLDRERWIIKRLAEIALGDRYEGEISVRGDVLRIGKDQHAGSAGLFKKDTALRIVLAR